MLTNKNAASSLTSCAAQGDTFPKHTINFTACNFCLQDDAKEIKLFATLQARAALAGGFILRKTADGKFLAAGSGGLTRDFENLALVEAWMDFVDGGRK